MKELVLKKDENVVTTSLIVAEMFEKEHKNVIQTIKNLTAQNSAVLDKYFVLSTYKNKQNKEQPMYYMNRDGFSLLVMGFNGARALKFKVKFIEAFNALEKVVRETMSLPDFTNPAIAARAWADEVEAKMIAQARIKEIEPAVDIVRALTDSRKEYGMSEVAKIMEVLDAEGNRIGRNKFFAALRIAKILRDSNEPYQRYVDAGYFIYKTHIINEFPVSTCYVTGKGLAWLQHNKEKIFK